MTTTQIELTDDEKDKLRSLVDRTGKTEAELLHEAVGSFLARNMNDPRERVALLRRARGIWSDRQDLPEVRQLREEFNRG